MKPHLGRLFVRLDASLESASSRRRRRRCWCLPRSCSGRRACSRLGPLFDDQPAVLAVRPQRLEDADAVRFGAVEDGGEFWM